jgi:hypothetical protein
MKASASKQDLIFRVDFESGKIQPCDFHHRDHLRLAYVYLCENDVQTAQQMMKNSIKTFLANKNIGPGKYHETLTLAWVEAVCHFMERCGVMHCFDEFARSDQRIFDQNIMLTHYSKDRLFSDAARASYLQPDIQEIPQY